MSVIRKTVTKTTSAIIGLDEIKTCPKSYRFWIMAPPWFETSDFFGNVPQIRESEDVHLGHPFLRPFDIYIHEGRPDIGKVFYILLRPAHHVFPKVICSITLSKDEKRIYIYPGWGHADSILHRGGTLYPKKSPIHHITLIRAENKVHMSAPRGKYYIHKKKPIIFPAATLKLENSWGVHLGTFCVNDADTLDSGGIVSRNVSKIFHDIKKMNNLIEESVNGRHPIIELPPELKWDKDHRLEISFVLTFDELKDVDYPTGRALEPPKEFTERLIPITLQNGVNLLMKISTFPGKMDTSFKWLTVRQR